MTRQEHSRCGRRGSLRRAEAFAWRQFGICFAVFYHYLFYQTPDFLSAVLQIQNSSNNMLILQLKSIAISSCNLNLSWLSSYPSNCSPGGIFYSLESCIGWRTPRSVNTGASFYVACLHFATLRCVSPTYPQLCFHRWKTTNEARRQTLPNVNVLQELGDIMKTKSVKFSPNTLYMSDRLYLSVLQSHHPQILEHNAWMLPLH